MSHDDYTITSIRIPTKLLHRLDAQAERLRTSRTELCRLHLTNALDEADAAINIIRNPIVQLLMRLVVSANGDPDTTAQLKKLLNTINDTTDPQDHTQPLFN